MIVTGIVYFTLIVAGLSTMAGFAILIVGIPFALLFIAVVRAVSLAEGRMIEGLLGERMPRRPRTSGLSPSWLTALDERAAHRANQV